MKYFYCVFLAALIIPLTLQAQTVSQTEVIKRHDSIQLLIDQLISKQRDEKKISSEHCDSINILLGRIKNLQKFYVKDFTSGILDSLTDLYAQKTKTLLESARDEKDDRYSDNAILAYEFASNRLSIFKSRQVAQITRDTIGESYRSLERVENHHFPRTEKKVKDVHRQVIKTENSITGSIGTFKSSVNDSFSSVNELLHNLQPKKNLSNYLILSGVIAPIDQQGGLIGAYARFNDHSDWYWGGQAVFVTKDEGRSITTFQAGLNVDTKGPLYFNFHSGISWNDQSTIYITNSIGSGVIISSKSYWNPRIGALLYFGGLKGVGIQVVLPVGITYEER